MEQKSSTAGQLPVPDGSLGNAGKDPPPRIADHELLRLVGTGGYGEVWLARHTMGMYRAVKIVQRSSFKDQRPFDRELSGIRRFEPISRSHEGFVDVLHVGIDEARGFFYYVMELGDDVATGQQIDVAQYSPKTLAKEVSARGRLPWQECLELGIALSHALSELHKHGLVHRDIKPSNIIFVNGVPKLADIGLVADVNDAHSYVGTMGFMPPEGPGTPQADIYSLGKVLYEVSTGKDRQQFPELPTQWDQSDDCDRFAELNEVILQACSNDPGRRYKHSWDLHADLLVLATGKSIKRLKTLERRWSFAKKAGAVGLAVSLLVAAFGYQHYQGKKALAEAREREVGANIAYGNRSMETGDLLGALPYFAEALRLDGTDQARQVQHRITFGSIFAQCPKLIQMWSGPTGTEQAVFSPDGRAVLVVKVMGQAQIFDVGTGKAISPKFGPATGLRQGAFSPDGRLVVTASEDRTGIVWRVADGAEVLRLEHPDKVFTACFSPDGSRILTACLDKVARVWDTQTGAVELFLKGHSDAVLFAGFSRRGRRIVTTSRDCTARIWDSRTGNLIGVPLFHPTWVRCAGFSPDGKTVATACSDHKARVWDVETGRWIPPDLEHHDEVRSVEFSPDGRLILTASLDHTIGLWRSQTHLPLNPNPVLRQSDRVTHACFSPEGNQIMGASIDGTLQFWDLAGSTVAGPVLTNSFSADGTCFLSISNGETRVYDTLSKGALSPIIKPPPFLRQASLSPNGRFVVTLSAKIGTAGSAAMQVWKTDMANRIGPPVALQFEPSTIIVENHGSCVCAFGAGRLQVWKTVSGESLDLSTIKDARVQGAAFSFEGGLLAVWAGGTVKVLDLRNGQERFSPLEHPFPVTHVEFSPNDAFLVSCGADAGFAKCYAQVWNTITGRPAGPQLVHRDGVVCARFDRDSKHIATASEDFTGIVWDALTGQQLTPALPHDNQVWTSSFNADGKWVVTASSDGTARAWSTTTGDPLTPRLRHLLPLRSAEFLGNDNHIITFDKLGGAVVWSLPMDPRSAAELISLSDLLCGDLITPSVRIGSKPSDSPFVLWQRLRSKYPSDFAVSTEEISVWHEFQARQSELEHDWFAAAFHLERLLHSCPGDKPLAERVARAKKFLKALR